MKPKFFISVFLLTKIMISPVAAQENTSSTDLFNSGKYFDARTTGQNGQNAEDAFLACRSGLVIGGFLEYGHQAVLSLHTAIKDCEKALELDPSHKKALISYAITIGFEGRRLKSPKLAKKAREILEDLVAEHPNDPLVIASLAGWHSEVAAQGLLARMALGARHSAAYDGFKKAFKVDKSDLLMRIEFAKFLSRRGKNRRGEAIQELNEIIRAEPKFEFEAFMQDKAASILKAVKIGKKKQIRREIKKATAFPNIEEQKHIKPYNFMWD